MTVLAKPWSNCLNVTELFFWYDAKQKLRGDFEALSLPGIEKIEIKNNEYPCPIMTKDGLT